jgi:hypothetical protein
MNITTISRQHEDLGVRKFASNPNDRLIAIHIWHLQIHEGDVGAVHSVSRDGLLSVTRLGHQFHIWLSFEEGRDALAQKRMIIDRHDPN